ncbi:hypothetical protein QQZ08_011886 [Neonectria magnoliae]|uniref:Acetylxylan esterase 2 n=1 Tax=Neonectria magnoliae TaxID=2732573 RepID=A0ABR1H6M6_9HYPO
MNCLYAIFALLVALVAAGNPPGPGDLKCPPGVHVIVARASQEAPGPGMIGPVAAMVLERIPASDMIPLDYPALLNPYVPSQTAGVANLTKMIQGFVEDCPETKIVLMGYSQGAHVTLDVLCGASEEGFPNTEPLPSDVTDQIAAVVLMGDPSFTAGQPYNVGTSKGNGIFPRQRPEGCQSVQDRIFSVCDAGDVFCEAGSKSLAVHLSYVANWGEAAADWAVSMVNRVY